MRGDSLRDFQAKVLAIAGLGVLAGVGALVDYWPTGSNVPAIRAGSFARPEVPLPAPASVAAAREIDAAEPLAAVSMTRRARAVAEPAPLEPVALVAAAGALPIGETLPLASVDFSPVPPPAAPLASATSAPAEPIALPAPPVTTAVEDRSLYAPNFAPAFVAPDPEPGFVMGTLKKTGAGIAKGGAITGASIMDAFRGVAGAFKKVSPFRDRSFISSN